MNTERIYPVILCGGSGSRLWPLSRKNLPKPFIPLIGDQTLFEQAVSRVSDRAYFNPVMVVAGEAHTEVIEEQLGGASGARLVVEPDGRNTAPAIGLAAALLPDDAIMLVCPSDHHIASAQAFCDAAINAAQLARSDYLVSFGIEPTAPETGYGYLERGEPVSGGDAIARFVEKPNLEQAKDYLASGRFSWNGGIFAFRAGQFLEELCLFQPEMARLLREAVDKGQDNGARFYPDADVFKQIDGDSIDYAVMEKTKRAAMVPANMGWSDIGNWAALADILVDEADEQGNIARAPRTDFYECRNILAVSDGPRISAVGLEDVCIVVSGDEVLVTTREGAQRVGKLSGANSQ